MGQRERVVSICKDGRWRTLGQIRRLCISRFNQYDETTAISARLREGARLAVKGYKKERVQIPTGTPTQLHKYRLVKLR